MVSGTALSTLLSQVLIAFTIEVDNHFEQRMPHTTAAAKPVGEPRGGPWLVSLPMWANFMRLVPSTGITVGELEARAGAGKTDLRGSNPGMVRWGYVTVGADRLVRPTAAGVRAQEIWAPLPREIESAWLGRYPEAVGLRSALLALAAQIDEELPDAIPENVAHGGRVDIPRRPRAAPRAEDADLSVLLAHVLLAFTRDFEERSTSSLGHGANALRVLNADGLPMSALPALTGVAKESFQVMLHWLVEAGTARIEGAGRAKSVRLTTSGEVMKGEHREHTTDVERAWRTRYGDDAVTRLRSALEHLVVSTVLAESPLEGAVEPLPGGWRAAVRKPEVLPHHPAASHRGFYPDGS